MAQTLTKTLLTDMTSNRPLSPLSRVAFAVATTLLAWETRRLCRAALGRLDVHMLNDIGINDQEAEVEAAKPFWRA